MEEDKERASRTATSGKRQRVPRDYRLPSPVGQVDTPGTPRSLPSEVHPLPPHLLVTSFYQYSSSKHSAQAQDSMTSSTLALLFILRLDANVPIYIGCL